MGGGLGPRDPWAGLEPPAARTVGLSAFYWPPGRCCLPATPPPPHTPPHPTPALPHLPGSLGDFSDGSLPFPALL